MVAGTLVTGCADIQRDVSKKMLSSDAHAPELKNNSDEANDQRARLDNLEAVLSAFDEPACQLTRDHFKTRPPVNDPAHPASTKDAQLISAAACNTPHVTGVTDRRVLVKSYVYGRIKQIDTLCDQYMSALADADDAANWGRRQVNTTFDLASMMMGLAKTPAAQLAYLAGVKVFYNSSADAWHDFLFLSPTPHKLEDLIHVRQATLRGGLNDVFAEPTEALWSGASRWVQSYAAACTTKGIRNLLDQAADKVINGGPGAEAKANAATLGAILQQLVTDAAGKLKVPLAPVTLGDQDPLRVGAIAWLIRDGTPTDADTVTQMQALVGADLYAFLTEKALKDASINKELQAEIAGVNASHYAELINQAKAEVGRRSTDAEMKSLQTAKEQADAAKATAMAAQARAEADRVKADSDRAKAETAKAESDAKAQAAQAKAEAVQKELDKLKAQTGPDHPAATP